MCGIVGAITKYTNGFSQPQLDVIEHLLYLDVVRGEDSTGAFMVDRDGDVQIVKGAYHGADFIRSDAWEKMKRQAWSRGRCIIGHNRKATRGNVVDENAHPFWVEDKIVLVHNGGVYGDHKKHADVDVDSHALAHVLQDADTPDKVEAAMNEINAAYALVWYDVANKKLNFLRNAERPLHWIELENGWLFASEESMLLYVIGRFNLRPVKRGKVTSTPHMFPEGFLNSWVFDGINIPDVEGTQLKIKEPTKYQYSTTYGVGGAACGVPFRQETGKKADSSGTPGLLGYSGTGTDHVSDWYSFGERAVLPWEKKIKYVEWHFRKDNKYPAGRQVRVLVDNIISLNTPAIVEGHTLDDDSVVVRFPIDKETLNRITAPGTNDVVIFTVKIDYYSWIRSRTCTADDNSEWVGHCYIKGTNPAISYIGETLSV